MEIGFYEQVATADWATFQISTLSLSSDYSLVLIKGGGIARKIFELSIKIEQGDSN